MRSIEMSVSREARPSNADNVSLAQLARAASCEDRHSRSTFGYASPVSREQQLIRSCLLESSSACHSTLIRLNGGLRPEGATHLVFYNIWV